jgi:uncharacterized SAM-binding protein YcdF (DUF218 family)
LIERTCWIDRWWSCHLVAQFDKEKLLMATLTPEPGIDKPRSTARALVRVAALGLLLLVLLFGGGFAAFVSTIERAEQASLDKADGIVVLTGGSERIPDGLHWLERGQGGRLLISGVATHVRIENLAEHTPGLRRWLTCCVDVGRDALNTVGNAQETRRWVHQRGYRSLLVVTSSYHMPRTMVEFGRHMPDVELIPAPVVTERLQDMALLHDPRLVKTLMLEYTKFLVAYARARLTQPPASADIAQSSPRQRTWTPQASAAATL